MNNTLTNFGKQTLKDLLAQCTDGQQERFKQMYCFHNRSLLINEAVDQMDENKIDWAIIQCERTIETNLQKGE